MQLLIYYLKYKVKENSVHTLDFERDMATNEQQDYHEQEEG